MKRSLPILFAALFPLFSHAAPPPSASASATAVATAGNPFDKLQTQIDQLFVSVATVEERISITEQAISGLKETAADLYRKIASTAGDVTALESELLATNTMIVKLQNDLEQTNLVLATKQSILAGECPADSYFVAIYPDGSVKCRLDAGTSGLYTYSVHHSEWWKGDQSRVIKATCDPGTVVTSGKVTADWWINLWDEGVSGRSYQVSANLMPIGWFGGGTVNVEARCLGLVMPTSEPPPPVTPPTDPTTPPPV